MEHWKQIDGFERYQVSSAGVVKKIDGGIMRQSDNGRGYYFVRLWNDDGMKKKYIHRLVAEAFIDNPLNKKEVNHIDSNPSNNSVENLEWVSHKENMEHMVIQGRSVRTEEQLKRLRDGQKWSYKQVVGTNIETGEKVFYSKLNDVKKDGFSPANVCCCCNGKRGIKQHKGYKWEYVL